MTIAVAVAVAVAIAVAPLRRCHAVTSSLSRGIYLFVRSFFLPFVVRRSECFWFVGWLSIDCRRSSKVVSSFFGSFVGWFDCRSSEFDGVC